MEEFMVQKTQMCVKAILFIRLLALLFVLGGISCVNSEKVQPGNIYLYGEQHAKKDNGS